MSECAKWRIAKSCKTHKYKFTLQMKMLTLECSALRMANAPVVLAYSACEVTDVKVKEQVKAKAMVRVTEEP